MRQFYYTIEEAKEAVEGKPATPPTLGSFNVEKVIRTVQYDGTKSVVLLDDFHEMTRSVPVQGKGGKPGMINKKEVICSEIYLNEADSARYKALTEVGA